MVDAPSSSVDTTQLPVTPQLGADDAPIVSAGSLRGKGRRIVVGLCAAVLIVTIARESVQQNRGARGPSASSYATSGGGLAALASLLKSRGVEVIKLSHSLDDASNNNEILFDDVLVVLDQDLSQAERRFIRARIDSGARVVAGGTPSAPWMSRVLNSPEPLQVDTGANGTVSVPLDQDRQTLATTGSPLVWTQTPEPAKSLGFDQDGKTVVFEIAGLIAVADTSILSNANLAKVDNAAFALGLLTPNLTTGRVVFAEAGLGFRSGRGAGLAAIPPNVRTMLIGFVLAAFLWMLAVGRRVGVADIADRPLPPGRYEHVAAVASLLDRAKGSAPAIGANVDGNNVDTNVDPHTSDDPPPLQNS